MANLSLCWMESRALTAGDLMALTEALDMGPFNRVDLVVAVEEAGTGEGAALAFQHAARNEEGAYLDFDPVQSVDLTATGKTWIQIEALTRFLGWSLSGTLETSPTVTIDVVARR